MSIMVGDIVRVKPELGSAKTHGKTFKVTKVMRVNVNAEEIGSGRPWRLDQSMIEPTELDRQIEHAVTIPIFDLGQVVTVKAPPRTSKWNYPADQKFVVIAVKDRINIAKLGGDSGRYWRFPPTQLQVVEI